MRTSLTSRGTPTISIDLPKLRENIRSYHDAVLSHGPGIRSHIKTHKNINIAQMQIQMGATGIASAKISEASVFVDAGIEDVVIAYPIFGNEKWERACELSRRCHLTVHVENETSAHGLSAVAKRMGVVANVRVEVDTGFHRTGGTPTEAVALAEVIERSPNLRFRGFTTHRSAFFEDGIGRPLEELGREEGELILEVAELARSAGIDVEHVVGGSTPTGRALAKTAGITEVCAGTYPFFDAGMADLGVCKPSDVSLSINATVVVRRNDGRYTIDGGGKTFSWSTYPGTGRAQYGLRVDSRDFITTMTEEHGIVVSPDNDAPELGTGVSFLPSHVCPVVNLTDHLTITENGDVVDVWETEARGRVA